MDLMDEDESATEEVFFDSLLVLSQDCVVYGSFGRGFLK